MKSEKEIREKIKKLKDWLNSNYSDFEEGIVEALEWVLEE